MNNNLTRNKNSTISDSDIRLSGFNKNLYLEEITDKTEDLKKKRLRYGIRNIVGLLFQKMEFSVLSSINYLAVYYAAYCSFKDKSIKMENSITLSSILTFSQFSTIWFGGVLKEYIHMKIILIIGGAFLILGSIGIMFLETLIGYKFMMVVYGIGIGIQETISNANASAFIPEKKGLINGLANISWTLACSFFNFIGLHIINPDKKDVVFYDDINGISDNITKYTIITVFCFLGFTTVATILIYPYKKEDYEVKLELDSNQENIEDNDADNNKSEKLDDDNKNNGEEKVKIIKKIDDDNNNEQIIEIDEDNISFLEYLKCVRLYTCLLMCSFKNIHNNLITSSFILFSNHYDTVSVNTQQYISSSSFIVNLIVTAILSLFIDKFKYRSIVIPSNILVFFHALTFQFVKKNQILFIIYFFLSGIFISIENLATFPHLLKVFGNRYIVVIFGIFCIGTGLCDLAMNAFVDHILSRYNEDQKDEYDKAVNGLFYITASFTLISVILMSFESEYSVLYWKWKCK